MYLTYVKFEGIKKDIFNFDSILQNLTVITHIKYCSYVGIGLMPKVRSNEIIFVISRT